MQGKVLFNMWRRSVDVMLLKKTTHETLIIDNKDINKSRSIQNTHEVSVHIPTKSTYTSL